MKQTQSNLSLWYGTTTEKILAWRELRQTLAEKTIDTVVEEINSWWTYTPWVKKTVDPYRPDTWPTPWDMINRGEFCRSAIALGQAYTLWLCSPTTPVELWLINNFSEKDIHLAVVIDKKLMLNYTLGQILQVTDCDFELLQVFTKDSLTHIKL